jgi:HAD superfamily hydrolase (TIGR01509 family)
VQQRSPGRLTPTLRALIFDFDGLILDTETPLLRSWQEVFAKCSVPVDAAVLAGMVEHTREPAEAYALLETQLGRSIHREVLQAARASREAELIASEQLMPGVGALLQQARSSGIRTSIASSSPLEWISPQLERLGLVSSFDIIRCRDQVDRVKSDPQVYLAVLADLGLESREAVALEDSPTGAAAALRCGIPCVAVPNPATAGPSWGAVDLMIPSLASISLDELAALLARGPDERSP